MESDDMDIDKKQNILMGGAQNKYMFDITKPTEKIVAPPDQHGYIHGCYHKVHDKEFEGMTPWDWSPCEPYKKNNKPADWFGHEDA